MAIHTSPLTSVSPAADFFFTRILGRLAVPFFFMVTGQFVLARYIEDGRNGFASVWKYLKKVMLMYLAAIIIYLPIGYYAGNYSGLNPVSLSLIHILPLQSRVQHPSLSKTARLTCQW